MIDKIMGRLTDDQIKSFIANEEDGQEVFDMLDIQRAELVGLKSRQYVNDRNGESKFVQNKKKLLFLQSRVPALESMISGLHQDDPMIDNYQHELYSKTRELNKLQSEMENSKSFSFIWDIVEYTNHETLIEVCDALAERIGKWFEAGNAGPGTITFGGKSYTAS